MPSRISSRNRRVTYRLRNPRPDARFPNMDDPDAPGLPKPLRYFLWEEALPSVVTALVEAGARGVSDLQPPPKPSGFFTFPSWPPSQHVVFDVGTITPSLWLHDNSSGDVNMLEFSKHVGDLTGRFVLLSSLELAHYRGGSDFSIRYGSDNIRGLAIYVPENLREYRDDIESAYFSGLGQKALDEAVLRLGITMRLKPILAGVPEEYQETVARRIEEAFRGDNLLSYLQVVELAAMVSE